MTPDSEFSLDRLESLFSLGRRVFWRHDVDFSLKCALGMAEFEADLDIRATYFLRVDEEEYRMPDAAELAERLLVLGHRVGTHVNLGLPRDSPVSDSLLAVSCAESVEKATRWFREVSLAVSLHSPPLSTVWRSILGFDNALGPDWKGRYVSDARGVFRQSPEHMLGKRRKVQINLHPEWWFLPASERRTLQLQELSKP